MTAQDRPKGPLRLVERRDQLGAIARPSIGLIPLKFCGDEHSRGARLQRRAEFGSQLPQRLISLRERRRPARALAATTFFSLRERLGLALALAAAIFWLSTLRTAPTRRSIASANQTTSRSSPARSRILPTARASLSSAASSAVIGRGVISAPARLPSRLT
jgi:hypothetical protein